MYAPIGRRKTQAPEEQKMNHPENATGHHVKQDRSR